MAPENYDLAFQLFQSRYPTNTTGEGVGLNLIKKVFDRRGGPVRLEPEPGKGSRMYLNRLKQEVSNDRQ
ncbi:MAG: sensor histidine kinase [Candidatus Marinimicrobia bacterium]|nr:sensor histidine kinase [Candidatus Neomarinimicrobiota bacterium]